MAEINAKTKLNIIIGDPIEHSLSPGMHNAGYDALGIADKFVYVASRVLEPDLGRVITGLKALGVNGITTTIPHKVDVMQYLDQIDPAAQTIGAVNTILNFQGKLLGYNTDWLGVETPLLRKLGNLSGKSMALLGAGGAARAIAYVAKKNGMNLLVINRTHSIAEQIADEFGGKAYNTEELEVVRNCDIVVNSTNVGMAEMIGQTLVPLQFLHKQQLIFDVIYQPFKTKLIEDALSVGAQVISGYEMLLYQGLQQFKIYTGYDAPEKVMRDFLEFKLAIRNT